MIAPMDPEWEPQKAGMYQIHDHEFIVNCCDNGEQDGAYWHGYEQGYDYGCYRTGSAMCSGAAFGVLAGVLASFLTWYLLR